MVPALPAVLLLLLLSTSSQAPSPAAGFTDVAAEVGLAFVHEAGVEGEYWMPESLGSGVALFDYDGDGDLDVYLVDGGFRAPRVGGRVAVNRLFRQEASGRFADVTAGSGLGDPGYGMGVAVGDVDGDLDLDVYVTNAGPDRLFVNRGDGGFSEETAPRGVDDGGWGTSAAFVDVDLDGDLDLYVAHYVEVDPAAVCTDPAGRRDYCGPAGFPGVADRLWRNDGGGRFTDVSTTAGIAGVARKGLGVASADLTGDGRPDLYVANDGEPNLLWANRGDGTFEDRAVELGVAVDALGRPQAGMGIALGDATGDGTPDLVVSHLRGESNTLYASAGAAGFADATLEAGLAGPSLPWTGFGTLLFDADHDGDLDLAVVNGRVTRGPLTLDRDPPGYWDPYAEPDQLFANDGRGRFRPWEGALGHLPPGNGRGLAAGDVDGDGDLDLAVSDEGGPARLLRNDLPKGGRWLVVDLADASRTTLGAEVGVRAGERRQVRPVTGGGSYLSASDSRLHFGLGEETEVDELEIRLLPGRRLRLRRLPVDRRVRIILPLEEKR